MLEGYEDLRNELVEILGGAVTEQDIDISVEALIAENHVTATPALAELNTFAQTSEGKEKLRSLLAHWIMHERDRKDVEREKKAQLALNHLMEALNAERREEPR